MTKNEFCRSLDVGEITYTHYCMDKQLPRTGTHYICDQVVHDGKCPEGKKSLAGLDDKNSDKNMPSVKNRVI